jgi:hypothetical protein
MLNLSEAAIKKTDVQNPTLNAAEAKLRNLLPDEKYLRCRSLLFQSRSIRSINPKARPPNPPVIITHDHSPS